LLALSLLGLGQSWTQAGVGNGSCVSGTQPCDGNTRDIGNTSCNGDFACPNNTLNIGSGRCNVSPEKLPCHSLNP